VRVDVDDIAFLDELVSIPSPSGKEDKLARHLMGRMAQLGYHAGRDRAGNVVGTIGNPHAGRVIALVGHMDTAPGAIPVRRENGRLHGRGSVDAKGPLAVFVLAAAQVAPCLSGARIAVIATVDEERQGTGARHVARTVPSPDFCVVGEPSGWDGVTLGYKGMLSVVYRLTQPSGHSAGPQSTPAERALTFWSKLVCHADAFNQGVSGRFQSLDASLRGFRTFSNGLEDGAQLDITLRLPPGLQIASLTSQLQEWCPEGTLIFASSDPPVRAGSNTPVVRALLRAIRDQGGEPRFKLKTGTSDMNIVGPAWDCPIVAYGPGDSSLDHTPGEHIDLAEFRRAVAVLSQALVTLGDYPG
jgi:LysW-gamma-L-lysine carboxypeptidase